MLAQWWKTEGSHLCAGRAAEDMPHVLDLFGDHELMDAEEESPEVEEDLPPKPSVEKSLPDAPLASPEDSAAANVLQNIERTHDLKSACLQLMEQTEAEENVDLAALTAEDAPVEADTRVLPEKIEASPNLTVRCLGDVLSFVSKKSSAGEDFLREQLAA